MTLDHLDQFARCFYEVDRPWIDDPLSDQAFDRAEDELRLDCGIKFREFPGFLPTLQDFRDETADFGVVPRDDALSFFLTAD